MGMVANHLGIGREAGVVAEVVVRVTLTVGFARALEKTVVPVRMEQRRTEWTPSCRGCSRMLKASQGWGWWLELLVCMLVWRRRRRCGETVA